MACPRLAQGLRRSPPLYPCVRAFFVTFYRPGPLTVSANSLDSFLPPLAQMPPWAPHRVVAGRNTWTGESESGTTVIRQRMLLDFTMRYAF